MNCPKTKELITERIIFFNQMLLQLSSGDQKTEFEKVKKYWLKLKDVLDNEEPVTAVINQQISNLFLYTIKPLLVFQKKQLKIIQESVLRQKHIQDQPFEPSIKMSAGEFVDYMVRMDKIILTFNKDIKRIRDCITEIKLRDDEPNGHRPWI